MSSKFDAEAFVRALYDATGSADWERAETMLTDDFFVTEADLMPFAGIYRGRDALRELYTKVMGMMDVTGLDLQVITVSDDHAVALLDMLLAGPPETRVPIAEMFRFRDGRCCEIRPYYFDPQPVIAAAERKARATA